jgi:hypothetical protein
MFNEHYRNQNWIHEETKSTFKEWLVLLVQNFMVSRLLSISVKIKIHRTEVFASYFDWAGHMENKENVYKQWENPKSRKTRLVVHVERLRQKRTQVSGKKTFHKKRPFTEFRHRWEDKINKPPSKSRNIWSSEGGWLEVGYYRHKNVTFGSLSSHSE